MISTFEKLINILKISTHKKNFLFDFLKNGRSIASYQLNIALKNYIQSLKTIIDIGANKGQFAIASTDFFPESTIYSFEPLPEVFLNLKKNTFKIGNIKIFNIAIGSNISQIQFYKNKYSHASSALPIHKNQTELIPGTSETEVIKVNSDTLDSFFKDSKLEHPILLKMDVQGFEKEVLKGGEQFLKNVEYILLETSFVMLYQEEPLFEEMNEYLNFLGFKLLAPIGIFQTSNYQILQMDVLYYKIK